LIYKKKDDSKRKFETWFVKNSKALLRNDLSSKTILIKQKCFHPFLLNTTFSIQNVLCKLFFQKHFFQNLSPKGFSSKPDALMHVEPPMRAINRKQNYGTIL